MIKTRNKRNNKKNKKYRKRVRHNRRYTKRGGGWFKNLTNIFTRKRRVTIKQRTSPLRIDKDLGKQHSQIRIRTPSLSTTRSKRGLFSWFKLPKFLTRKNNSFKKASKLLDDDVFKTKSSPRNSSKSRGSTSQ